MQEIGSFSDPFFASSPFSVKNYKDQPQNQFSYKTTGIFSNLWICW